MQTDMWLSVSRIGDHTSKGILWLENTSGTSGNYKVLRYYRSDDNDDDPWNQTEANRTRIHSIGVDGGVHHWIIHRLTMDRNEVSHPGTGSNRPGIYFGNTSAVSNIIANRVLIQEIDSTGVTFGTYNGTRNTIQNSVIRTLGTHTYGQENQNVELGISTDAYVINNEISDGNKCVSAGDGTAPIGAVVENNDCYLSDAGRSICGTTTYSPSGTCSGYLEAGMSYKNGGTSAKPLRVLHNRIWGLRYANGQLIQSGDNPAISISADAYGNGCDYCLIQNNIVTDVELGIWNYHSLGTGAHDKPDNASVIGNLIYHVVDYNPTIPKEYVSGFTYRGMVNSEWYLNTVIDAKDSWFTLQSVGTGNDIRCNVAIASGKNRNQRDRGAIRFQRLLRNHR